jgi:SAM-dependent methyltransferase
MCESFFKLAIGMSAVTTILKVQAGCPDQFRHVLDFGCGVGRLCLAWSKSAAFVTGVDVSASMIQLGKQLLNETRNVELVLNEQDNLKCFATGKFDLICSLACLQHMPWTLPANYVREFAGFAPLTAGSLSKFRHGTATRGFSLLSAKGSWMVCPLAWDGGIAVGDMALVRFLKCTLRRVGRSRNRECCGSTVDSS